MTKILYIDMDGTLVDFESGKARVDGNAWSEYLEKDADDIPGIFSLMDPMPKALPAVEFLKDHFDLYILSTAPWDNPSAWRDKLEWIQKHLGDIARKRLILSHNKHLNKGHYLIDDRPAHNNTNLFEGELIHFASDNFPHWPAVVDYLVERERIHTGKPV